MMGSEDWVRRAWPCRAGGLRGYDAGLHSLHFFPSVLHLPLCKMGTATVSVTAWGSAA